ncbi:hypothetical protein GCM10028832_24420 [Streptomyces sparsus]
MTTDTENVPDTERTARLARFGKLPERIPPEDTFPGVTVTEPDPARDAYDSDEWLIRYCA